MHDNASGAVAEPVAAERTTCRFLVDPGHQCRNSHGDALREGQVCFAEASAGLRGRGRFDDPTGLEFRGDRPYDDQTASHLLHPNGTSIDFYDRTLGNVLTREVLAAWDERGAA